MSELRYAQVTTRVDGLIVRITLYTDTDKARGAAERLALDPERVLVLCHFSGRGKASGLEAAQWGATKVGANLLHVRDGKVTRLVIYWDRTDALADLGLAE